MTTGAAGADEPARRSVDHLLIGGGIAGAACAEELRRAGASGSIVLVGRELDPPYHRPPCTKELLRAAPDGGPARILPDDWWAAHDVELRTRTSVTSLDPAQRIAVLSTKERIAFGTALLATGAMVRRLAVDGSDAEGIHYVRTPGNAAAIRAELDPGTEVLVVGGSYVGCEVAASLTELGCRCTVLMQEEQPMERGFGATAGRWIRAVLEARGVRLLARDALASFEARDGRVTAALTARGERVAAGVVVIGAGAVPDVALARRAGLALGESGGIAVDAQLRTSCDGIYAAGDVAELDSVLHGRRVRIEHEDVAAEQGRTVARNMLGADAAHVAVPTFWSDLSGGLLLEYAGLGDLGDEQRLDGDLGEDGFALHYLRDRRLVGALTVKRPAAHAAALATIAAEGAARA